MEVLSYFFNPIWAYWARFATGSTARHSFLLLSQRTVRDASTWGTWLRTLQWWRKEGKERKKKKKPSSWWDSNPPDLLIMRRALKHSVIWKHLSGWKLSCCSQTSKHSLLIRKHQATSAATCKLMEPHSMMVVLPWSGHWQKFPRFLGQKRFYPLTQKE